MSLGTKNFWLLISFSMPLKLAQDTKNKFDEANKKPDICGWLLKKGGNNNLWQQRYFVMLENWLFYSKKPLQNPQGIINMIDSRS